VELHCNALLGAHLGSLAVVLAGLAAACSRTASARSMIARYLAPLGVRWYTVFDRMVIALGLLGLLAIMLAVL
jgi:hypothetical protein